MAHGRAQHRAAGASVGFPRVAADFQFLKPLRFEDEFEVHICIAEISEKRIRYTATVTKDGDRIATGSMTIACVTKRPGKPLRSTPIPTTIADHFSVARTNTNG